MGARKGLSEVTWIRAKGGRQGPGEMTDVSTERKGFGYTGLRFRTPLAYPSIP